MRVDVENGKYTFITKPNDYRIFVLRYGKDWLIIESGSNAISGLMNEVEELSNKLDKMKALAQNSLKNLNEIIQMGSTNKW